MVRLTKIVFIGLFFLWFLVSGAGVGPPVAFGFHGDEPGGLRHCATDSFTDHIQQMRLRTNLFCLIAEDPIENLFGDRGLFGNMFLQDEVQGANVLFDGFEIKYLHIVLVIFNRVTILSKRITS